MATAEQARQMLSLHGALRPQPTSDWNGEFPLSPPVESFYQKVGPCDLTIESYGNPFFLPSLARLWRFQAGYRWNGRTGEPSDMWDDDWLVVGSAGDAAFIFSRASGMVMHALHGGGIWEPGKLFPDLNTMAACLGQLGAVVSSAGEDFTDGDCYIRPQCREQARLGLQNLLGSPVPADFVLEVLGWG